MVSKDKSGRLKVLHIVNWYPNIKNPNEAVWIMNHIKSIDECSDNDVVHLQVVGNKRLKLIKSNDFGARQIILQIPTRRWIVIELLSAFLLVWVLLAKMANRNFDLINFHIAYPNLCFWHWIKKIISKPVFITEHWSAYHFNFGVEKKLPRIQNIFRQNIPVIAVSRSLIDDIRIFSQSDFPGFVVPNVVDNELFQDLSMKRQKGRFFMVSQWKDPKKPFLVIEAFKRILRSYSFVRLVIGGYGPQWPLIEKLGEGCEEIELLGRLTPEEIVIQLNTANAFVHPSDYETFSVVCAEALACHCPVVASKVGGIPEFVNSKNGILVEENTIDAFSSAMEYIVSHEIPMDEIPRFSEQQVGLSYCKVLKGVIS